MARSWPVTDGQRTNRCRSSISASESITRRGSVAARLPDAEAHDVAPLVRRFLVAGDVDRAHVDPVVAARQTRAEREAPPLVPGRPQQNAPAAAASLGQPPLAVDELAAMAPRPRER